METVHVHATAVTNSVTVPLPAEWRGREVDVYVVESPIGTDEPTFDFAAGLRQSLGISELIAPLPTESFDRGDIADR